MALTPKNLQFLEDYVITGNAAQSYAKIYHVEAKSSNPWKILKNEEAQEYLQWLRAQARSEKIADLQECLESLTDIIRNGTKAEALKAIDMRLKSLGAYVTKQEVKVETPTTIKVTIESEDKENA